MLGLPVCRYTCRKHPWDKRCEEECDDYDKCKEKYCK
jgi:hypothetical protein